MASKASWFCVGSDDQRDSFSDSHPARDVFKQMKGQKNPQELYNYLFGFDYLEPKYDLKVDGKDLSELSPGERGGLLLIFYLMLDRQEIPLTSTSSAETALELTDGSRIGRRSPDVDGTRLALSSV